MSLKLRNLYILLSITVFIGLPILFFVLGDFPTRTVLKNSLSILTILTFFVVIGQMFLSKINKGIKKVFSFFKIVKIHKIIGYSILPILIIHPFLVVIPRFFEVGVSPFESFINMITTIDSLGIILGLIAWILMFILGITSMFRDKLNMSYKTWKIFHGLLSFLFILFASWHTIDIGRHINIPMTILIIILVLISTFLLLKTYLFKKAKGLTHE